MQPVLSLRSGVRISKILLLASYLAPVHSQLSKTCSPDDPLTRMAPCNGHGECSHTYGLCVCDDGWSGFNCSIQETPCQVRTSRSCGTDRCYHTEDSALRFRTPFLVRSIRDPHHQPGAADADRRRRRGVVHLRIGQLHRRHLGKRGTRTAGAVENFSSASCVRSSLPCHAHITPARWPRPADPSPRPHPPARAADIR